MRDARFRGGWVLALWLAACSGSNGVRDAGGELRVSPKELAFDDGYVGYASEARVYLENTGLTELVVQVAVEGPFQTQGGPYRLPGAADITKTISFVPSAAGEFTGEVRYSWGDGEVRVSLSGRAVEPPTCVAAGPCFGAAFDPSSGVCQHWELRDGEACETGSACLVDGICRNHECLGTARDCSDGDPCSDDSCDPMTGCLHSDIVCDPPANPCERSYCKRGVGCTTVVDDGKTCGENSGECSDRYRCRAGACEPYPVPDGQRCFAACGPGACEDKVCVRATTAALDEVPGWTSQPVGSDRELFFPGLTAEDGTVVWLEAALDGTDTHLVTASPIVDGDRDDPPFMQRDVLLAGAGVPGRAGAMLAGDRVVIALDGHDGSRILEARFLADGTPAWDPISVADLLGLEPLLPEELEVLALVDGGNGGVRVISAAAGKTALLPLAADGTPGPLVWLDGTPVQSNGELVAIADADGRLYLTLQMETERRVVSLWGDLSNRWVRPAADDDGGPLAVANGLLVIAPGHVLDTRDGSPLYDLPLSIGAGAGVPGSAAQPAPGDPVARTPLLGATIGFAILEGEEPEPPKILSFDLLDGMEISANTLELPDVSGRASWTSPSLNSRNNAVVAMQFFPEDGDPVSGLLEFRPDGFPARACRIPGLGALGGPPVFEGGWFAFAERHGAVKLYELGRGGRGEPADRGWAGLHGGPSGGNRELR